MTAQAGLFVARDSGGNGTTPQGARTALAGLLAKNSDGTVRVGVLADGQGPVVTGAAGMSYNVRKHVAVTKATEANGPVLVPNDGVVNVSTDPAPGSNSRIDVIYVWQRLVTGDGGSETTVAPVIDVAKGATSASPVAPALPSGALELARVTVPSGTVATSGLTFTPGQWTVANGGPIPVRSDAERAALSGMDSLVLRGTFTVPSGTGAVNTVVSIPGGPLPGTSYAVTLSKSSTTITDAVVVGGSKTTTQFTVGAVRANAGVYTIDWILAY